MSDGVVLVKQSPTGDRAIDNETVVIDGETRYRQRVKSWSLDQTLTPKGYEQIASLAAAAALTVPAGAVYAMIEAETNDVRWRDDGTNPTATVGMKLLADSTIFYTGDLAAIRFIETTATAKLNVAYYA